MRKKFLLMTFLTLLFTAMGTNLLRAQELYVSCDYNSSTDGWGTTRFSNYSGAYAYATANATNATIVVEKTNTLSGNTFDNNHKNYSRLAVVIKDGATMGNALSKWDMTYPVTVEPGGTLTCARPKTSSVSYIHIKNTLTVGAEGSEKKAYVDFLSDTYQDCDISIRWNGKIYVYNSVFKVQDLDAQGTLTITDSDVTVDGAFASATSYATTLTNTTMTVNGNQISGGISDFAGGDSNQLGKVTLNNSTITINEGTTKVAATVTANGSEINVNDLTINSGKTVKLNGGSVLDVETLNIVGTGSVVPDETSTIQNNGQIIVAMIGQNVYTSLKDALSAASAMTGDVTVEIYEKVTLDESLSGYYSSIKFVGKDTDAEIYLDVQGYITATGKNVAFEDLKLSKSEGGFINNAGFMNVAFGVYDVTEVTYTNCTFANGAYASSGNVTYTGCTFKRSHDKYGLWAYGNVDVTVDDCIFDDYRGIKMYAEGAAKTVDLTVKNTDFSAVTDKPAIVLTYGESVTLENNTYSSTGVFELDLDGAPNGTPINYTDNNDEKLTCKNDNGPCGVLCDGKIYTTVAQAAQVATPGSTVTLLHDSAETVELPAGVILDKNGYVAAGITVTQPVAQVGETPYYDLQDAIVAAAPSGTVEILSDVTVDEWIMFSETLNIGSGQIITMNIDGLTINGNGKTVTIKDIESAGNGNRLFYDATKLNINNWTIKYADGVAGGIGLTSGTINKVTIEGGAGVFPGIGNITISECNFKTSGHCIYFEEERDNLIVTNNTFELPADANVILLRGDVKFTDNIVVSGRTVNVVSGSPEVTGNDFNEVRFKVYNAATATIENNEINVLAFNDNSVVLSTFGENTLSTEAQAVLDGASFPVAQIGETKYGTLQAALQAAAQTEELTTIQLLAGTHTFGNVKFPATLKNVTIVGADNKATIIKDSKLYSADGNAVTYKGITFDGIIFDNSSILFTGARNGEVVYEDWTIKNCDFRNLQSTDGIAAIHFNLAADETIKNFTFEDNTITNVTSPSNTASGLRLNYVTGNVVIKDNETNNVAFNAVQIINSVVDNFTFEGNILRSNGSSLANLYNVTGENIVITKNQFLVANEDQKGVSNIAYADVSGNYWGGGAPINLPEGVVYSSYYTTVESDGTLGGLVELPQGNQPIAYVKEVDGYVRVWGETWGNAKESYALELYSGETKIATTELNNVGDIINGSVNVTWNFFYPESTDEYWTTTWHENPHADKQPDKVVLVIDGVAVNEGPVYMSGADGINPVVWADLGGVISGGTWGGIDWTLVDGTLTITPTTGTPELNPNINDGTTRYAIGAWREAVIYNNGIAEAIGGHPYDRSKVKTLIIKEGVISIGSFTAQSFTNLTGEVVIPYTVNYIGQEAFQKSTMTTLTFAPVPEGKNGEELCIAQGAFKNLIIEEVSLPADRPVHLHAWVFNNCHNLKNVTIPATVVSFHGTNHIDYFEDFNQHSNPTWTHSSEIFAYNENMETVEFGSEEVMDRFYTSNNGTDRDYLKANVGLVTYCDVDDAIDAAKNGGTITLVKNTNAGGDNKLNIPSDANITIDLQGRNMTCSILAPNANLTVKNGTITNNDASVSAIEINKGTLTIENVNVNSARHALRIDGEVTATINGGTYKAAQGSGTGTYHAANISGAANVTIEDGTFVGPKGTSADSGSAINVKSGATVTVKNGNYSGGKNSTLNCNGTLQLYGGKYDQDPTAFVADNYVAKKGTDGLYVVFVPVAEIAGIPYATLQEALDAAAAGTGNVTVEILEDIDLTNVDWNPVTVSAPGYPVVTVEGNNKTITGLNDMLFAGTWAGGSGLIINNLTIANSTIVHDENDSAGNIGVGAFIGFPQASATITLNNCHLVNSTVNGGHWTGGLIGMAGGYNGNDGPVFMNLTIEGCSVTGSTITGKGSCGGIIGHGSCAAWTAVNIQNTTVSGNTVTSTGSSTNKAGAVMGTIGAAGQPTTANGVTMTGGAMVAATVSGNTVTSGGTAITTIYGRQGTNTGILELNGGTYDNYPIEENVAYAKPAAGLMIEQNEYGTYGLVPDPAYGKVAMIGETYYETLSAAFAAVTGDEQTVVILSDVTEKLEGAYLRGNITTKDGTKVTITLTNVDWVYCPYTFILGENITLNVPALFYYAGGAQINGTVVAGAYYQRYAGTKLTINEPGSMKVTTETFIVRYMDGDPNAGIYIIGDNNDETIGLEASVIYFYQGMINAKDADIKVGTYWQTNETDDNEGSANLVLDNSNMTVTVNEHNMKATANSTVTLTNGSNVTVAGGYQGVGVSIDATSSMTMARSIFVSKINNYHYTSLQEAATAATTGQTIELLWQEGQAPIAMNASLYGNKNVTITGTATVDWSKGNLFIGRGGVGNATLTFNGADLTSASNSSSYGIHVSGREKDTNDKYDGTLVINNSTIELDYLINKGTMTLDESTLTVKNGFSVGGRPASETESGADATATMTLNNNSKVVVNNHNGMGLGYEAIGVMNVNSGSTFECTQAFLVTAKGTMNVAGTATIAGTFTNNGTINFTDLEAKLATTNELLEIVDNVNNPDYKVVYKEGAYQFVEKVYVAQIGENKYESLQEAVAAAQNDETITLLVDVDVTTPAYGQNALNHARAINFTLDLNGKTLSANTGNSVFRFNIAGSGATGDVTVTIKNGKVVSGEDTWCTLMSSGISADVRAVMNLEDLDIENNKGGDFAVKAWANGVVNAERVTINSTYGGGFYAPGGEITLENCTVNQKGLWTVPYNSMAVAVSGGGKMTVNSGTYSAAPLAATDGNNQGTSHGSWTGGVMNSGGTLIINGGTFSNDNYGDNNLATAARGAVLADTGAEIEINGGTFNALKAIIDITNNLGDPNNNPSALLSGGTFSADPRISGLYASELIDVAEGYDVKELPNGYYSVIQVSGTQTREFAYPGWYWFSTYIDFESGEEGLDELQEQLGDNAATIKGQTAFTNYQYYNGVPFWTSALTSISASEMYMIKTTNECLNQDEQIYENVSVSLEGKFVEYENYEITIHEGWNWIGYPLNTEVSVRDALAGFTPAIGDQIKGKTQGSTSTYMNNNKWVPNFNMIPGEGYMYHSTASENKILTYSAGNGGTQNAKTSVEDNHWIVDEYKYSNNMTVIAMLSIDGEIVKGNYEVAAFANGECRGSARPIYIESIDAYVLFMTIHGDEVEELTFMYYDIDKDTEYELSNVMNYSNDAIVGTIDNPYIFSMNILGIGENSIDNINIYPNPTTTDREINLQAICDKVEVFNALGVKVAEYHNVDTLDALETAGIYVIRITNDNAVKHCRLVVK